MEEITIIIALIQCLLFYEESDHLLLLYLSGNSVCSSLKIQKHVLHSRQMDYKFSTTELD
jgi:hypothetical protein